MKQLFSILALAVYSSLSYGQITLQECLDDAKANYPLIEQYGLVDKSTAFSVSTAARAYLPQVSLNAQATYQSDVPAFPDQFQALFAQTGIPMAGINKDQYRIGIDINQNIWDGGASKSQRLLAATDGDVQKRNLDVQMYELRGRIYEIYFGILLLDEQLSQNELLQNLLKNNYDKLMAYVENGTAMASDANTVKVELLSAAQQRVQIESGLKAYKMILSIFVGRQIDVNEVFEKPQIEAVDIDKVNRPELKLLDAQLSQLDAQKSAVGATVTPKFGAFAQGFTGNPGLNMFNDMIYNRWSFNYIVGLKMQWNIGGFYTKRNSLGKIEAAQKMVESNRRVFLFNNSLATTSQKIAIEKMERVMADDNEIIALRSSIRESGEAKLKNGVIDVNDLLKDITTESQAKVAKAAHEIELLKNIYDLKNSVNE